MGACCSVAEDAPIPGLDSKPIAEQAKKLDEPAISNVAVTSPDVEAEKVVEPALQEPIVQQATTLQDSPTKDFEHTTHVVNQHHIVDQHHILADDKPAPNPFASIADDPEEETAAPVEEAAAPVEESAAPIEAAAPEVEEKAVDEAAPVEATVEEPVAAPGEEVAAPVEEAAAPPVVEEKAVEKEAPTAEHGLSTGAIAGIAGAVGIGSVAAAGAGIASVLSHHESATAEPTPAAETAPVEPFVEEKTIEKTAAVEEVAAPIEPAVEAEEVATPVEPVGEAEEAVAPVEPVVESGVIEQAAPVEEVAKVEETVVTSESVVEPTTSTTTLASDYRPAVQEASDRDHSLATLSTGGFTWGAAEPTASTAPLSAITFIPTDVPVKASEEPAVVEDKPAFVQRSLTDMMEEQNAQPHGVDAEILANDYRPASPTVDNAETFRSLASGTFSWGASAPIATVAAVGAGVVGVAGVAAVAAEAESAPAAEAEKEITEPASEAAELTSEPAAVAAEPVAEEPAVDVHDYRSPTDDQAEHQHEDTLHAIERGSFDWGASAPHATVAAVAVPAVVDEPSKEVAPVAPESPKIIFVLGGPGAGKVRTITNFLLHLSTGDLLRDEVKERPTSELATQITECFTSGSLVPMSVVMGLLEAKIKSIAGSSEYKGVLVDGYPREVQQATEFEKVISPPTLVLSLHLDNATMTSRLLERGKTSGRADDNEATISKRLATFEKETVPVVEFYESKKDVIPFVTIDASQSIASVYKEASEVVHRIIEGYTV
ncbi:adenylate kinase [Synchytrium microbalum]|uniref:Adenylate kinase n=1 Tax=Synchytrium microbalum TaxID=1806994 RepID=A0A507CC12_9FUNG|nr:adenylate kinase [Synchytrium microbalum]TPX35556.1 adenylate kinase [Synchytrium microbalum]